jgi:hypothetical protein
LAEVLTTASKTLRGGLSLEGDLWPERETESDEEESMDQAHLLLLIDELDAIGVSPAARPDALNRASQYFGGHDMQDGEVRDFAQQPRKDAPPLFRQGDSAPTTTGGHQRQLGQA